MIAGRGIRNTDNNDIDYLCKAFTEHADRSEQQLLDQQGSHTTDNYQQTTTHEHNKQETIIPVEAYGNQPAPVSNTTAGTTTNSNYNNNIPHNHAQCCSNDNREHKPECITSRNIRSLRLHLHHVMRQGHLATALQEVDAAEYEISALKVDAFEYGLHAHIL